MFFTARLQEMMVCVHLCPFTFGWNRLIFWSGLWNVTILSTSPDDKSVCLMTTLELNIVRTIPWLYFPHSVLTLLLLSSSSVSSQLSLYISVAMERGPRRSFEGRILIGCSAFPRTSSHQSDWSGWWYHPHGSPTRPRFQARSHIALYSLVAPVL